MHCVTYIGAIKDQKSQTGAVDILEQTTDGDIEERQGQDQGAKVFRSS